MRQELSPASRPAPPERGPTLPSTTSVPLVLEGHIQIAFSRILRRLQQRMLDQHAEAVYAVVASTVMVFWPSARRSPSSIGTTDGFSGMTTVLTSGTTQNVSCIGLLFSLSVSLSALLLPPMNHCVSASLICGESVAVILRPVAAKYIIQREIVELALRFQRRFAVLVQKNGR